MSCDGVVSTRRFRHGTIYLKHVLERVCGLLPLGHPMFVSFSHDEIEILIRLPLDYTIVLDTLLVMGHCTPSVSMERLEERQCGAVQSRIKIQRRIWKHDRFYAQDWGCARDEAKGEVSDGRMIVRERPTRREERAQHERARYAHVRASIRRIKCAVLLHGSIAARSTREEPTMDVADGPMRFDIDRWAVVGVVQIKSLTDGLRPKNER